MTEAKHQFLWTNIQTTGLAPYDGSILEWAFVLADDGPGGSFEPVEAFTAVVHAPADWKLSADSFVVKMHTQSGLAAEVEASDQTIEACEAFLRDWLGEQAPKGMFTLAGFSPHFALAWYRVHMPKLATRFAGQVFDVSTLRKAAAVYGPGELDLGKPSGRAMPSVGLALEVAKAIIDSTGWTP